MAPTDEALDTISAGWETVRYSSMTREQLIIRPGGRNILVSVVDYNEAGVFALINIRSLLTPEQARQVVELVATFNKPQKVSDVIQDNHIPDVFVDRRPW